MGLTDRLFVGLNRLRLRGVKKRKVKPADLLLLFSLCLQRSECPQKIINDLANCKRCGECLVKSLLELSERYGIQIVVASGGAMALEKVRAKNPQAIVAIACEKELRAGIRGVFPKPVVAIPNKRPKGPCKDCVVDLEQVEKAVQELCV